MNNTPNYPPDNAPARVNALSPWSADLGILRVLFAMYLLFFLGGFVFTPVNDNASLLILPALLCYIAALVYAYKAQRKMNEAKVYLPGAWQVIVGGVILNPIFGWVILWSVMRKGRKHEKEWASNKMT